MTQASDAGARLERLAASPGIAAAFFRMHAEIDVRPILPAIQAPTLVMHRAGDRYIDIRHSRYIAEHGPGARLVELPGEDTFPFSGDQDVLADEIEEFLTGARHSSESERILATVMFCDMVESTQRAAVLGDRRWRDLVTSMDGAVARELSRYRGRAVKTMGDGFLATFAGPARGIRCASAIRDVVRSQFGIERMAYG